MMVQGHGGRGMAGMSHESILRAILAAIFAAFMTYLAIAPDGAMEQQNKAAFDRVNAVHRRCVYEALQDLETQPTEANLRHAQEVCWDKM